MLCPWHVLFVDMREADLASFQGHDAMDFPVASEVAGISSKYSL
jgi:hypothetical protein